MTLISNAKAEKLNKRCVKIQQNSLDVDWFCHEMAQKLCAVAGKTYWYCNDYDVEVVDFDPVAGDVICVAVVLVTATYVTQKVVVPASASTSMPCQISSLQVVIIPQLCICHYNRLIRAMYSNSKGHSFPYLEISFSTISKGVN